MSDEPQEETVAQRIAREKREQGTVDFTGATGVGSSEPKGEVLSDEETPSNVMKSDGSRSPHDASSEGGNRQEAAHKQVQAAEKSYLEGQAALKKEGPPGSVNAAPTEAQAESGRVAREEGRAD